MLRGIRIVWRVYLPQRPFVSCTNFCIVSQCNHSDVTSRIYLKIFSPYNFITSLAQRFARRQHKSNTVWQLHRVSGHAKPEFQHSFFVESIDFLLPRPLLNTEIKFLSMRLNQNDCAMTSHWFIHYVTEIRSPLFARFIPCRSNVQCQTISCKFKIQPDIAILIMS